MSNIVSTGVSRRFQNLFEASGQAVNLAPSVAKTIVEDLEPVLQEGEVMPDVELLQKLLGRRIALANEELENGDHMRKHLKNVDRHRREIMKEASDKLRQALVDVRYILDRTVTKQEAAAFFEGRSNLSRLKSPVLERVSARLVTLLGDPKFGWDQIPDSGHRASVEANRLRLQSALAEFEQAENEGLPEKNALVLSLGNFERDLKEKGVRLRYRLRFLAGFYQGAGFEREAAALVLRRRATPKTSEEKDPPKGMGQAAGSGDKSGAAGPTMVPAAPASVPPGTAMVAVVPWPAGTGIPALPASPVPAAPPTWTAAPPARRKRRRSRRRSQTAQSGFSPETPPSDAEEGEALKGTSESN